MPQPGAARIADGLRAALADLAADPHVAGVVAVGSYVAGTMTAASDVDLIVLHRRPGDEDRRYCRERRHGVLLDTKFWTPEVAQAMLCGPEAAGVLMASGGARVLLDRDGSAARLCEAIVAAAGPAEPPGAVERLVHTEALRKLAGPAREACAAGDEVQAWCIVHWCAGRLVATLHRLAGVPHVDLGQGLRDARRRFPREAAQIEECLGQGSAEAARAGLLAVAERLVGEMQGESEAQEFDTGWIAR